MKLLLVINVVLGNILTSSDYFSYYYNPAEIQLDSIEQYLPTDISTEMLINISNQVNNQQSGILIQRFPSGLYATQSCQLDLFKWNGQEWVNQYKYGAAGHNCGSLFFEYEGDIFNYGGYGFWHRNSQTLFFDSKDGGWGLTSTINIPEDYSTSFTSVVNDTLFCLTGIYVNQDTKRFEFVRDGGFIQLMKSNEWKRFYWKKYTNDDFGESGNIHDPRFELKDYTVFGGTDRGVKGFLVFEKKSKKLFYLNLFHNELSRSPFYKTTGNVLQFIDYKRGLYELNIDEFRPEMRLLAEVSFNQPFTISQKEGQVVFVSLSLVFFVIIILSQHRKIKRLKYNGSNGMDKHLEIDRLILKLKSYSGQNLETDQLDKILDISQQLTPEGVRGRRSKLISEINVRYNQLHGADLIMRARSTTDKRYFSYNIR